MASLELARAHAIAKAQELGILLDVPTNRNVVLTGYSELTPLGGTDETWQGYLEERSGVKAVDAQNFRTSIGGPVNFTPEDHFDLKTAKILSRIAAMSIVVAREAGKHAGLLDLDLRLKSNIDRNRVGAWVSSGYSAGWEIINVWRQIHSRTADGLEDPENFSRFVSSRESLKGFPEQQNGHVARLLGISGWGGNLMEACDTGLANPIEAAHLIKTGEIDVAFAGGFEDLLNDYTEVGIGIFASIRAALSTRNEEPEKASRPFDRDRDGFVLSSGGGVVVLEEEEHAKKRGVPILGRVLGYNRSMDGYSQTVLDPRRVAATILASIYNKDEGVFYPVESIFAHATATRLGDILEGKSFRLVFGDSVVEIPISAIKGNLGHLAGGAGTVNLIAALKAIQRGIMPPILNLDNPDTELEDLFLVRGKPLHRQLRTSLAVAYGFGSYNSALLLADPDLSPEELIAASYEI